MKSAIIYYSWTGKTDTVAKVLQQITESDLLRLEEVKSRSSSPLSFIGACGSALFGGKSKLRPLASDLKAYDTLYLGSPIWAGRNAPALNAFISNTDLSGKKVYLFITQGDVKTPQAVYDSLKLRIEAHGGKIMGSTFIQTAMKEALDPEKVRQPLTAWLKK